jgi:hypothetical protein
VDAIHVLTYPVFNNHKSLIMKKSLLLFFLIGNLLNSGCIKQEDQSAQQTATSFLGVENITDYDLHDVLVLNNKQILNSHRPSVGSYEVFQFFSKLGNGQGSAMRVNGLLGDYQQLGKNYHFGDIDLTDNTSIKVQYQKGTSQSLIGPYTLEASQSKILDAKVSFNMELGMDKTKDLEFKWITDESFSDEKVFISVCIAGSPCIFYETDDSGTYTIPATAISHVKSGVWGSIFVTRARVSSLPTSGGALLKTVRSTTSMAIFDVI